jgi:hypothetical protein
MKAGGIREARQVVVATPVGVDDEGSLGLILSSSSGLLPLV